MAIEDDRHLGKRADVWFPEEEHKLMMEAMQLVHENNKSVFIRSAVRNFARWCKENYKEGE